MRKSVWTWIVALLIGLAASVPGTTEAQESDQDQNAAMMEAISPDENHDKLDPFVGRWRARILMWEGPGEAEPIEASGTATFEWIMNGRYLRQSYRGTYMDMPFSGLGYVGYDRVAGHYVSVWMDNFGTGIMHEIGYHDAATNVFTSQGTFYDPVTSQRMTTRSEHRLEGPDRHVVVMWVSAPGGSEHKSMEIEYTR